MLMTEGRWKIIAGKVNVIVTHTAHLLFEEWNVLGVLKVISQEVVKHSHSSMSYSLQFCILCNGFGAEIGALKSS